VWPVARATAPGLREDAAALLAAAVSDGDAELSVLLCTDDFIADLNSKWRNIARPTDVLSFPQGDNDVVRWQLSL
jgi:ssRNA-specific RNase YbeY (16S rRNA maturation enzyme)